jgi:hypothetical protein
MNSALYVGSVMHRRLKPRAHRLRYRMFWMLLDLDELAALSQRLRLFSVERFNLFGFRNADHGDGSDTPLRAQVEKHLAAAGLNLEGGAIRLLCMPRILGYVFNPISVYYCYDRAGDLAALLYEVHNTFGQRHSYLIAVDRAQAGTLSQRCVKALYVSPFIGMDIAYDFRVRPPSERITLAIQGSDAEGPVIVASLAGERRELTDAALARVFATHPLMTLKVTAGIHWDALKLWLKGVQLRPRPPAPAPVTIVRDGGLAASHPGSRHV